MEKVEKVALVEGKVDWKGRPATKYQHGGTRPSLLILATLMFENMANLALAVNLVTYFIRVMHFDLADAANTLTNFMGTSYLLAIVAAFVADSYVGRFRALLVSVFLEFLGLGLLAIQAHYSKFLPPICNPFDPKSICEKVSGRNLTFLMIGLYLIALGFGGIKSALPSHGADQFDEKDPREAKQLSSFFNWLLLAVCLGGSVSLTFVVWIQDNKGWDWGFGVSTLFMLLATIVLVAGLPMYRVYVIQKSNAITEIFQVYIAAIRNRKLGLPKDPEELYEIDTDKEAAIEVEFLPHRDTFRYLDKAAIQPSPTGFGTSQPEVLSPWKLCRVTQVENAKIVLGIIPIFCSAIIMSTCLAQLQTFSIQQGLTMDTRIANSFHIPPASLPIIPLGFMILLIPVYDQIIVPFIRKFTGHITGITHLQRVGVGLVLSSISMGVAAIVEVKRKGVARDHNMLNAIPVLQPLPISVFWLSFQYFIFGIADMFTFVGLLEFFYSEAPKGLKAISTCFLWCAMALGYYFSTILVNVVNSATKGVTRSRGWLGGTNINRNHLNLFYWLLSILSLINFCNYLFWAKRYKYRLQPPPANTA